MSVQEMRPAICNIEMLLALCRQAQQCGVNTLEISTRKLRDLEAAELRARGYKVLRHVATPGLSGEHCTGYTIVLEE